jgi:copper resistance protein B
MKRLSNFGRPGVAAIAAFFALASAHAQESGTHEHEQHATGHAHAASEQPTQEDAQSPSSDHVAPLPPQHPMEPMSGREMIDAMEMDDAASTAILRLDRLERADGDDGAAAAWKFSASFGGDFDKLLVRSEGEHSHGEFERADAEALWSHAVASYWDTQVGVRRDFGRGADRSWAAFGVQGLAPYWFEIGATAYVGDAGRTALRLEVDYDLSLTQRLILQPRVEVNAYGEADRAARVGAGLSDAEVGLRLRYEIRRELAPYVGVERSWLFGGTADFARSDGRVAANTKWVVGLRVWY